MRPAVEVLVRRRHDLVRHLEGNGLAGFQRHFDGLPWGVTRLDGVHRVRNGVVDRHHQLTEAPADAGPDRLVAMNIGNGTAVHQLAVLRIVIGGPERLHNRHAEPAMRPGRRTERMVVPEDGPHVDIHPPPIADKLRRREIACRVVVLQRLEECHDLALDVLDTGNFLTALVPRQ
ncbi:MAG: hypothetical protein EWM72_03350 [Nitrospira sp.]|nr:MAG: hypothetical protein EWM72_03350 [Nitrospira sp.]